jgi:hypothetical protein
MLRGNIFGLGYTLGMGFQQAFLNRRRRNSARYIELGVKLMNSLAITSPSVFRIEYSYEFRIGRQTEIRYPYMREKGCATMAYSQPALHRGETIHGALSTMGCDITTLA